MSTAKRLHYTYEEYLSTLEMSEVKLEYCDGVIYAMAGGTPAHAALSGATLAVLRDALRGKCVVYTSDLRVRIEATGLSTFPDVSVVCGPVQVSSIDRNVATNPSILVEVTSRSTEDYDRGDKLNHYQQLPSLMAVLFVSHKEPRITLIERRARAWEEREFRAGDIVTIADPSCSLGVNDLYGGITLDPA